MTGASSYHHGDLRSALLDAVGEIVAEKGIDAVSIREAARRAGVSHSAPAHHFGDKAGMIVAYAQRGFGILRDRLHAAMEQVESPSDKLNAIGFEYLRFSLEERHYFEIMFRSDLHDHDPTLVDSGREAFEVLSEVSIALADGDDSVENAELVALNAWTCVHGMATLWADGMLQEFWDGDDLLELAADVFIANLPLSPAPAKRT